MVRSCYNERVKKNLKVNNSKHEENIAEHSLLLKAEINQVTRIILPINKKQLSSIIMTIFGEKRFSY